MNEKNMSLDEWIEENCPDLPFHIEVNISECLSLETDEKEIENFVRCTMIALRDCFGNNQ